MIFEDCLNNEKSSEVALLFPGDSLKISEESITSDLCLPVSEDFLHLSLRPLKL